MYTKFRVTFREKCKPLVKWRESQMTTFLGGGKEQRILTRGEWIHAYVALCHKSWSAYELWLHVSLFLKKK